MRRDQTPGSDGTGVRLRVLTYNIHGQRDDRTALAAVVRELAPDVAILQEAPRRFRWRHKCAALADAFGMVVGAGGLPGLGNLLLTSLRVSVTDSWVIRYPLTPGRHLRGAVFARCAVGPVRFVLAGSHLATDAGERPAQARALREACRALDQPVILGVDVNETPAPGDDGGDAGAEPPGGSAWATVCDGLTDAVVAADRPDAATFPCADPRRRLDAIFVDPSVEVLDYQVVDTPMTRRASDHFPVVADLSLAVNGGSALAAESGSARGLDKRGG
ncbi:endonuclease/exonuclease/phosphatase family protein [Solwaraspora sp. WMMD406]|uniref:endonuclease/exonuclease/phosphatase family protein n=1 Tax=Solwaraspora sp. WMMD406 TaxID=3016095 RepID=UPI002415D21D|nr:endonuclease/exonuclease/phosphatase family protein [Solwaraspora sp. WMMD406]MDG4765179.1 endonuclease/exonuclease/phosphatase family protein [Solwaraspora sp. WMMD406]